MGGRFLISGTQLAMIKVVTQRINDLSVREDNEEDLIELTNQLLELTEEIFDEQFIIDSTEPLEFDLEQLQKNWRWKRPKEVKWDEARSGSMGNTK